MEPTYSTAGPSTDGTEAELPLALEGTFAGLEPELHAELATFESFFKTFGFKRIHGRVWGLLVLAGQPLSAKEVVQELSISQGAASTTINELVEWGAVSSTFDSSRRCNVHEAVGNTLSIVATVLRRREQVAFEHFKVGATRMLEIIRERNGNKDPRVLTLRSIVATCDLADAVMQLVFSSVSNALGDPQSLLSKAIGTALKVGVGVPARVLQAAARPSPIEDLPLGAAEADATNTRSDERSEDESSE
ncbi:MAG: MarR family transcriptional regulator [Planctomycetota bacterium]